MPPSGLAWVAAVQSALYAIKHRGTEGLARDARGAAVAVTNHRPTPPSERTVRRYRTPNSLARQGCRIESRDVV
jgi:hypothetical protein